MVPHKNIFIILLFVFSITATAHATVVYDNGSVNDEFVYENGSLVNDGDSSFNTYFIAQDFSLENHSLLKNLTFNALINKVNPAQLSSVSVNVYSSNSGSVGDLLWDTTVNANDISAGQQGAYDNTYNRIDFSFELPDWELAAGTFWLALKADTNNSNLHWRVATPNKAQIGYLSMQSETGDSESFVNYEKEFEHYFKLEGQILQSTAAPVPEPATVLLLGAGLVAMAAFRRKSKK